MLAFSKIKIKPLGAGQIRTLFIIGLGLFCIGGLFLIIKNEFWPEPASAAWLSGYSNRRKITFNNSGQSENLFNFPVLIKLSSSNFDFDETQSAGQDIRFVDANSPYGTGVSLDYQIEKWDAVNEVAYVWVKVPQINSGSTDDYIWLYYTNPAALDGQAAAPGVWSQNYKGVWHLREGIGTSAYDVTGYGNNGLMNQTDNWTSSGKIDGAYNFDGDDDFASSTSSASLTFTDQMTIEAWVDPTGSGTSVGTIRGVTDSLNFYNQIAGIYPDMIPVYGSNDIYAVAYIDADSDGWIKTIKIDTSGRVVQTVASLEYDNDFGHYADLIRVANNVYAIAYNNNGHLYLKTVVINSTGTFGTVKGPINLDNGAWAFEPDIIKVTGNVYAIVSRGPGVGDGQIKTVRIDDNGDMGATAIRSFTFTNSDAYNPKIISVGSSGTSYYFAVTYDDTDNHGWLKTFKIVSDGSTTGTISYSSADSTKYQWEWDNYYGEGADIIKVNGSSNIYALAYKSYSAGPPVKAPGKLITFSISSTGDITKQILNGSGAGLNFDNTRGFNPKIVNVSDNVYAIAYGGPNAVSDSRTDGWLKTLVINAAGTGTTLLSCPSVPGPGCLRWETTGASYDVRALNFIPNAANIYTVAYEGPDGTGWLKTLEIETNKGIFKSDAYGLNFDNTYGYGFINNTFRLAGSLGSGWNYLVMTYNKNAASQQIRLYVNGQQVANGSLIDTINSNVNDFFIGRLAASYVDEVRVSNVVRSADWIKAQYLSVIGALTGDYFVGVGEKMEQYGSRWAWSENLGWFNLDCPADICVDGRDYEVYVPSDGGAVSGDAWSEHIGWVCFGATCSLWGSGNAPDGRAPWAQYDKQLTSSEISGWAKAWALGDEGWISLRPDAVMTYPGDGFALCYDCDIAQDGRRFCRICHKYKDEDDGYGYGPICSNCTDCEGEGGRCSSCPQDGCYDYGLAYRQDVSKITGWAWNGNWAWNGSSYQDDGTKQPGIGWLQFDTDGLTAVNPWLQTKHGDIYSGGSISGPTGTPPGQQANATYLIHANGLIDYNTFKTECEDAECTDADFGNLLFPNQNSGYFGTLGRIDFDGIEKGYYGEVVDCSGSIDLAACAGQAGNLNVILDGKIYVFDGNLTINSPINIKSGDNSRKGNGLIIVKGNLTIKANITYNDEPITKLNKLASIGWVVVDNPATVGITEGGILISPDVSTLAGVFYAERLIDTCEASGSLTGCEVNRLNVSGVMVSYDFNFDRTYTSATEGSEIVIDDGRALVNTPPGLADLVKGLPIWQQTAP